VKEHIFLTGFHAFMGKCPHDGPVGFGTFACRLYCCVQTCCLHFQGARITFRWTHWRD